jgi:predicted nucleic acid-binding protein
MRPAFVDTSLWYALVDERDLNHDDAVALTATPGRWLTTTNWVFGETLTLTRNRLGHAVAVALGARLLNRSGLRIVHVGAQDEQHAWGLFRRYHDKDFSFTDCTSFAVMRRLRISHALAFDHQFQQMGFRVN